MTRSIGDLKLLDACQKPGCPVCRCVEDDSRRQLDGLLYELVNDPDARKAVRAAWGFCNWHGWMALGVAGARTGLSILHADALRSVADRFRRTRRSPNGRGRGDWRRRVAGLLGPEAPATEPLRPRRSACLVCQTTAQGEDRYLGTMCLVGTDDEISRACAGSDGLCARHLLLALDRGQAADAVVDQTLQKWADLAALLDDFVGKHEYRNRTAFTEAEARACERAVETLSGRPGVWGNDRGGDRPRDRRQTGDGGRRSV